jgi:hypothetical protein
MMSSAAAIAPPPRFPLLSTIFSDQLPPPKLWKEFPASSPKTQAGSCFLAQPGGSPASTDAKIAAPPSPSPHHSCKHVFISFLPLPSLPFPVEEASLVFLPPTPLFPHLLTRNGKPHLPGNHPAQPQFLCLQSDLYQRSMQRSGRWAKEGVLISDATGSTKGLYLSLPSREVRQN